MTSGQVWETRGRPVVAVTGFAFESWDDEYAVLAFWTWLRRIGWAR